MPRTLEEFKAIPFGEIFAKGVVQNTTQQLYMTENHYGRTLKRVAKKGNVHDWAMYVMRQYDGGLNLLGNETEDNYITVCGDEPLDLKAVQRIVNVDDEVMKLYRK